MSPAARRAQHLLGLVGFIFLIMLTCYQWSMSDEKRAERIYQLQEVKKQTLREMCESDRAARSEGKPSIEDLSHGELDHFLVDDNHGVIYCYIPKVACTNWKRVMLVLRRGEPYVDPMSIPSDLVHTHRLLTHLTSAPITEMKAKLRHYTKFMFVRDPFVRIISAYRDKFLKLNEYFYQNYGRNMLRLYANLPNPPQTAQEAFSSQVRPSFQNFVQYLLDPDTEKKTPFEPHWRQMHRLCHPCLIEYDFVGHQESLQEEALQLLSIIKMEDAIRFPTSYVNMTSSGSMLDWFRSVPLEDRRKLFSLYEEDFRLFGYSEPQHLLND